jgi:flagellin
MNVSTHGSLVNSYNANMRTSKKLEEQVATGDKINSASDNSAALSIATKLHTQQTSLSQGTQNAKNGLDMLSQFDKAAGQQNDILGTIKGLLIQAADSSTSDGGRINILKDIKAAISQLDEIANDSNYNGISFLDKGDAAAGGTLNFQVGENVGDKVTVTASQQLKSGSLGTASAEMSTITALAADGLTAAGAADLLSSVDDAITQVSSVRADLGAGMNSLESRIDYNEVAVSALKESEDTIMKADLAELKEQMDQIKLLNSGALFAMTKSSENAQSIMQLLR